MITIDDVYWDFHMLRAFPKPMQEQYLAEQHARLVPSAPDTARGLEFHAESIRFQSSDVRIAILFGIFLDYISERTTQNAWTYRYVSSPIQLSILNYPEYVFASNAEKVRAEGRDFGLRAASYLHMWLGRDRPEFTGWHHGILAASMTQWDTVRPVDLDHVITVEHDVGDVTVMTEYYPTASGKAVGLEFEITT